MLEDPLLKTEVNLYFNLVESDVRDPEGFVLWIKQHPRTLAAIESRMRPDQVEYSTEGFLGPGEHLIDLLEEDIATMKAMGVEAIDLSRVLNQVVYQSSELGRSPNRAIEVNARLYFARIATFDLGPYSRLKNPITGESSSSAEVKLYPLPNEFPVVDKHYHEISMDEIEQFFDVKPPVDLYDPTLSEKERAAAEKQYNEFFESRGAEWERFLEWHQNYMRVPFIMPELVYLGFFEGKGSPYRLSPEVIAHFFGISHNCTTNK